MLNINIPQIECSTIGRCIRMLMKSYELIGKLKVYAEETEFLIKHVMSVKKTGKVK